MYLRERDPDATFISKAKTNARDQGTNRIELETYSFMNAMQTIGTMEVVGRQYLLVQGVLRANGNDGLGRLEGLEPFGLSASLAPGILLLEYMEQCHNVPQTAIMQVSVSEPSSAAASSRPRNFSCFSLGRLADSPLQRHIAVGY